MDAFSKRICSQFEIRKTKKQKEAFIQVMTEKLEALNYSYEIQKTNGLLSSKNLIVGNVKQAKLICTAHYDTCATMGFLPNFITPLNMGFYLAYQIGLAIGMIVLAMVMGFVLETMTFALIPAVVGYVVVLCLLMYQLLFGYRNPKNYNDNTSGVMVLLEALLSLPVDLRDQVCFVFFDNEEKGLLGSGAFAKVYRKDLCGKVLVNYDCVSDGDTIFMKYNKEMDGSAYRSLFEKVHVSDMKDVLFTAKGFYPSDQKSCDRYCATVGVAALKRSKIFGLYMDRIHTPNDTAFDERNIEFLKDGIVSFARLL